MAWEQHYRIRYEDHVRNIIGDCDKLLFDDDELRSYIEKHISCDYYETSVYARNSRYRIYCHSPVYQLNVSTGVDGAVYILDEHSGWIIFDPEDPDNTAVAPVDGTSIRVEFYRIKHEMILSELFMELSSNHAKLVAKQKIMGSEFDLQELSDAFYAQAVRWESERVKR